MLTNDMDSACEFQNKIRFWMVVVSQILISQTKKQTTHLFMVNVR